MCIRDSNTAVFRSKNGMINNWGCDAILVNCFIANNKQNGQHLFGITGKSGSITVYNSYIDTKELLYASDHNITIENIKNVSIRLRILSTGLCPRGNYFEFNEKINIITNPIHVKDLKALIKRRR